MSSPVALSAGSRRGSPRVTGRLAGQEGLEPPTAGFGDRDSSQLSYCPVFSYALTVYLIRRLRRHARVGTLTQPEGSPPELQVYVADRPPVEPQRRLPGRSGGRRAVAHTTGGQMRKCWHGITRRQALSTTV